MNDSTGIDGNKFIWNGATIEDSSNCYFQVRKGSHAGQFSVADTSNAPRVLRLAREAQNGWTKAEPRVRIAALLDLSDQIAKHSNELAKAIMWDTDKCAKTASAELENALTMLDAAAEEYARWNTEGQGGRPVGSVVCFGPETASTFCNILRIAVPVLLVGCTVVVKVPCSHGLVHIIASQLFHDVLPPGVAQFLLGPAEELITAMTRNPFVDMVAVTGDRGIADRLVHAHPNLFVDLASEVLAVITADAPDLNAACKQIAESVLTERDQSHLKLVMVHGSIAHEVLRRLAGVLKEWKSRPEVLLAPSCDDAPPERAQQLVIDALRKGAMVVNAEDGGGRLVPLLHGTTMQPALVYPVNDTMRLWQEDLRGTGIIPVASFEQVSEVVEYARSVGDELQVSLFALPEPGMELWCMLKKDIGGCNHVSRLVRDHIHESPAAEARRLFQAFLTDAPLEQPPEGELRPSSAARTEEAAGPPNPPLNPCAGAAEYGVRTAGDGALGGAGQVAEAVAEGSAVDAAAEEQQRLDGTVGVFGSPVSVAATEWRQRAK